MTTTVIAVLKYVIAYSTYFQSQFPKKLTALRHKFVRHFRLISTFTSRGVCSTYFQTPCTWSRGASESVNIDRAAKNNGQAAR